MLKTVQIYQLQAEYAPYDKHPSFQRGFDDYNLGCVARNTHGVAGQAYDRGAEYAMRVARIIREG